MANENTNLEVAAKSTSSNKTQSAASDEKTLQKLQAQLEKAQAAAEQAKAEAAQAKEEAKNAQSELKIASQTNQELQEQLEIKSTHARTGLPVVKHDGKQYNILGGKHHVKLPGSDLHQLLSAEDIAAPTKEGAAIRDHLLEIGSGILQEVVPEV